MVFAPCASRRRDSRAGGVCVSETRRQLLPPALPQNQGKILNCMHDMKIGGRINLATGIQIAQLALKHR